MKFPTVTDLKLCVPPLAPSAADWKRDMPFDETVSPSVALACAALASKAGAARRRAEARRS